MRVAIEPDIDALDGMPQLVEGRIEIQVDAQVDRTDKRRIAQHARNVDQQVGGRGRAHELVILDANGFPRVLS